MPSATKSRRPQVRPRVKVWLEIDDEHAFCTGMCRILQAIEQTGSIKSAAAEVGRSYRFVWGRLKEVEQACGVSLVDAHVGGNRARRSSLTPAGRAIVQRFTRLQRQLFRVADNCAADLRQIFAPPAE